MARPRWFTASARTRNWQALLRTQSSLCPRGSTPLRKLKKSIEISAGIVTQNNASFVKTRSFHTRVALAASFPHEGGLSYLAGLSRHAGANEHSERIDHRAMKHTAGTVAKQSTCMNVPTALAVMAER